MIAILSPLGLYGGNQKAKLPLRPNTRIHTSEGHFGNLRRHTIRQMPRDHTLRSLDAHHAIPTCVLRFTVSGLRRRTPVRPVSSTGQTGTHRSDRSDAAAPPVFGLGFVDQPRNPMIFW
jgi:hypothetical protein